MRKHYTTKGIQKNGLDARREIRKKHGEYIDVVILWVDGGDKDWVREKNKWLRRENNSGGLDDVDVNRYQDWDNVQYIFRGIEKYMPWVRKVHFVTNGQKPKWLNLDCKKLNWVKHEDFIPKEYLPTFSSHPIELNLHRIKGLSEKFIYFNDDMFITSAMKESDFFKKGIPCQQSTLLRIASANYDEIYWHVLLNNAGIINRNFEKNKFIKDHFSKVFSLKNGVISMLLSASYLPLNNIPGFVNNHVPGGFLKSTFRKVWEEEQEVLDSVCHHRFRNIMDVNQYLISWWQMCSGRFYPKNVRRTSRMFTTNPVSIKNAEIAIKNGKYKLICINDQIKDPNEFSNIKTIINNSLNEAFPDKSEFEL